MFHKFGFYLICCKYILCNFNNKQSQKYFKCKGKALKPWNCLICLKGPLMLKNKLSEISSFLYLCKQVIASFFRKRVLSRSHDYLTTTTGSLAYVAS